MAENEDGQEKSEEPSAKKLADAKNKGEVPRSKELNTTLVLLTSAIGLLTMGGSMGEGLNRVLRTSLIIERELMYDPILMLNVAFSTVLDVFFLILPFLLMLVMAVFLSPILLGGFAFSGEKMKFKMSNISPLKGMKRLLGTQGLMELVKSILKIVLIGGSGTLLIMMMFDDVLRFSRFEFTRAFYEASNMIGWFFLGVCATIIVIAAIDVPFQIWQYKKQQRMTKKEVKDERKNMEGSPELKSKIRSLQMDIAMRRMMEEIPKADVVITNPTHFAVALKYDEKKSGAPVLLAKGSDLVAARIRELAKDNEVPIVTAPPLARAVFFSTELDQEIPERLYLAVAQILAYIYQLKQATNVGATPPDIPTDLDVPDDMWKDK